ncbi:MAG: poly(ethylene terephthalate) hydrolase family protein [Ilumatobacteraceae bacterium]
MLRQRAVPYLTCLLILALAGCASGAATEVPPSTEPTAAASTSTTLAEPPPTPVQATEAAQATGAASTSSSADPGPPSLPIWPTPSSAIVLPVPSGDAAVGVAASGFPDTVVYYPAVAGTGRGHRRYVEPDWASAAGLDPAQMDRVVSAAQIDATPAPAAAPRPVVLLTPGWRSIVAFSTSLAEDLASHGYVVLATQTDVVAEWSHPKSTTEDRNKRFALVTHVLDYVETASLPALVGPIDVRRIAVGGHSYAGTIAFDASLTDRRIAVMIDIDGSARGQPTARTPQPRPSLVLVTVNGGAASDPSLGTLAARSPHIVPVGVVDALHLDVTDAPSIPSVLGTSVFSTLLGRVGAIGTTDTSTIVRRFLDATLGPHERQPSGEELVEGLPSATSDPFGSAVPVPG